MIEQQRGDVRFLHFSHYPHDPLLTHGIFTRLGGQSAGPYTSLNTLGSLKGGDSYEHVVHNRQLVLQSLHLQNYPCATLWNIHGADVAIFDRSNPWRTDWANSTYYTQPWTAAEIHKADAIITQERGIALALSFADCTPILLYDPVQQGIGIAHGGWRGTARGVVFATIDAMVARFGSRPQDIYAGIGPTIGACCYEITETVQQFFTGERQFENNPTAEQYRKAVHESAVFSTVQLARRSSLRIQLDQTNYRQLLMAGLSPDHIELADICTSCHKDRFFSHRSENSHTGRFPAVIALRRTVDDRKGTSQSRSNTEN